MDNALRYLVEYPRSIVITPTHRLSRVLLQGYNRLQVAQGLKSWDTPDVLPWQSWLQRLWFRTLADQDSPSRLLNESQSRLLWESIIERHSEKLLNLPSTADRARQCRELLYSWAIDHRSELVRQAFFSVSDSRAWYQWHETYQTRLFDNNWIDAEALPVELINLIPDYDLGISNPVVFVGFDEMMPIQLSLIERLAQKGIETLQLKAETSAATAVLYIATDEQAELYMAARWARAYYESSWQPGDDPIGVVIPSISRQRTDIERIFREVFYPRDNLQTIPYEGCHGQGIRRESIFNLSLGRPISQESMIRYLFDVLTVCSASFDQACLSRVITSPFFSDAVLMQGFRCSQLDIHLRSLGRVEWTLGALVEQTRGIDAGTANLFLSVSKTLDTLPVRARHSEWVQSISQLLKAFGWPGNETTDSYDIQVLQAWDSVLSSFAQLQDISGKKLGFNQMLSRLKQIAANHIFQAGSGDVPVQIMGMIEASGMHFSALRICGMQDRDWPPSPSPNPFMPMSIQRHLDVPHSSARREYDYARRQLQRLLASSEEISISYAAAGGDEAYRPSSLVAHFPRQTDQMLEMQNSALPKLECVQDVNGLPLNTLENPASTFVLRDQSQCPFRAYIKHRLLGTAPETPEQGIDPRTRGIILHEVMERLWRQWKDQKTLQKLTDTDVEDSVQSVIQQVITRRLAATVASSFAELESRRLKYLVLDWISLERKRQPFRVLEPESEQRFELNGLRLSMRIDRIDELSDGSLCVIDYKTGQASPVTWCGDRPEEPQLPLYCLAQQQPVSSVAFARLRTGETALTGLTADHRLFSGDEREFGEVRQLPLKRKNSACAQYVDWASLVDHWQRVLSAIAADYMKGGARVDPIDPNTTCGYCEVHPVCRIFDPDTDRQGDEQ